MDTTPLFLCRYPEFFFLQDAPLIFMRRKQGSFFFLDRSGFSFYSCFEVIRAFPPPLPLIPDRRPPTLVLRRRIYFLPLPFFRLPFPFLTSFLEHVRGHAGGLSNELRPTRDPSLLSQRNFPFFGGFSPRGPFGVLYVQPTPTGQFLARHFLFFPFPRFSSFR